MRGVRSSRRRLLALLACAVPACSKPAPGPRVTNPRPLFEAFVQAWNRHDAAALDTLIASDAVEEDLALGFHGEGPGAFKDFMRQTIGKIPDFDWKPTNVVAEGSKLAAEWTLSGTYTGDTPRGPVRGKRFSIRGASAMVTHAGRITRFSDYYSPDDLYRQVMPQATEKRRVSLRKAP
jgi:steroid delta-isomerase-like uncharacterized protein